MTVDLKEKNLAESKQNLKEKNLADSKKDIKEKNLADSKKDIKEKNLADSKLSSKEKDPKNKKNTSDKEQPEDEVTEPLFQQAMKKYQISCLSVKKEYKVQCLEEAIALFKEAAAQAAAVETEDDTLAQAAPAETEDDTLAQAAAAATEDNTVAQPAAAETEDDILAQAAAAATEDDTPALAGMDRETALEMVERCRRDIELANEQDLESKYQAAAFWMKSAKTEDRWRHVTEGFESVGDYKDARELAKVSRQEMERKASRNKTIRRSILGTVLTLIAAGLIFYYGGFYQYAKGYAYMKSKKYELAGSTFRQSPGFLKSDAFADYCTAQLLLTEPEGNTMTFGNHSWIILRRTKGIVTLIATGLGNDDPLKDMPFSDTPGETTWAESSLRAWLNGEFLDEVFSEKERALLVKTESVPSVNIRYGSEYTDRTEDYVTILGGREALKSRYMNILKNINYSFWLRTPGSTMDAVAYMDAGGSVRWYGNPAHEDGLSVLPVVRIDSSLLPAYENQ